MVRRVSNCVKRCSCNGLVCGRTEEVVAVILSVVLFDEAVLAVVYNEDPLNRKCTISTLIEKSTIETTISNK